MSRIVYKIFDDWGEAREYTGEGLTLTVSVLPKQEGYLTIGDITKAIRDGEAKFNLERLCDGEYTPLLFGKTKISLEPICKKEGKITPLPTPDSTVRRLLFRTERTEEELRALEERLDGLYRLIEGRIIF